MASSVSNCVRPESFQQIVDACASAGKVLPRGAGTKAALLADLNAGAINNRNDVNADEGSGPFVELDMRGFSGVVSYDPSEFLISARAGTSIAELTGVLAEQGQYLPFDPVLSKSGATLGGSIASGISGPCRLLYGSLRDFMLEVQMCDSAGREIRGGGKVVKNAAGFDLPKLVVGSYGRMGVITEATLKVFPCPAGWQTLVVQHARVRTALDTAMKLMAMPLPIAALEIVPSVLVEASSKIGDGAVSLMLRLAGPVDSLAGMTRRVVDALPNRGQAVCLEHGTVEAELWSDRAEFSWTVDHAALVRVAVVHHQCDDLWQTLESAGFTCALSCAATVAWVAVKSLDDLPQLNQILSQQKLSAVVVRGTSALTLLGDQRWVTAARRIQASLDPAKKWLAYP